MTDVKFHVEASFTATEEGLQQIFDLLSRYPDSLPSGIRFVRLGLTSTPTENQDTTKRALVSTGPLVSKLVDAQRT